MQNRLSQKLAILGGTLLCIGLGALYTHRVRASVPAQPAEVSTNASPGLTRAAIALVQRGPVTNTLSIAGEFLPYQEVELHAKVAGYIRRINVDIGDRVREGQVLAVLEVPELNAQVEGADAGVRHSREEIVRAEHEVARSEADHAALHANAIRLAQASAVRPGLIAQQELDDANAKDRAAEAQVEAAKSALAAAQQQLAISNAGKSQVSAMQDYSRIVAPFDGVVTWRYADTGALIQAGTSNENSMPVVKLAQINILRMRVPVPESLAARVHIGTPADIRVQATGERIEGKVTRFTDSFDLSTRTMQVEVDVPNPKNRLSPGMYADVFLQVADEPDALTVPVQAISRDNDNRTSVLVLDRNNRVQVRQIRTGVETPDRVQVLAGLAEGDRVIVGNLASYQPGEQVDPKLSNVTAQVGKAGGTE